MNHAITIGGLLLGLSIFVGVIMAAVGALMGFAAGMSDAGDDGTGGQGCVLFLVGIALVIGGIAAMVLK